MISLDITHFPVWRNNDGDIMHIPWYLDLLIPISAQIVACNLRCESQSQSNFMKFPRGKSLRKCLESLEIMSRYVRSARTFVCSFDSASMPLSRKYIPLLSAIGDSCTSLKLFSLLYIWSSVSLHGLYRA